MAHFPEAQKYVLPFVVLQFQMDLIYSVFLRVDFKCAGSVDNVPSLVQFIYPAHQGAEQTTIKAKKAQGHNPSKWLRLCNGAHSTVATFPRNAGFLGS